MVEPTFIPGLELCEGFFFAHVQPILERGFPQLRYSAGLIGYGSEVLGFDTAMSTDHHWGPRAMLLLEPADLERHGRGIGAQLARELPPTYRGFSTHFTPPNPLDHGTQLLTAHESGPVNHRIELTTIVGFFLEYLDWRVGDELTPADWLSFPTQKLRALGAGRVFRDDLGLDAVRKRFASYPDDVGLFVLGSLWARIGQDEHLMGRAAHVGDELGSALIAARLVRDVMRILFCLRREYPPYPKWFGSAFARLDGAPVLRPHLEAAVHAQDFAQRENALCAAYEALVGMQAAAGLPVAGDGRVSQFWGRPFRVIQGERVAAAVFERIRDPRLTTLAKQRPIGNLDALSDSTDVLDNAAIRPRLRALYEE